MSETSLPRATAAKDKFERKRAKTAWKHTTFFFTYCNDDLRYDQSDVEGIHGGDE